MVYSGDNPKWCAVYADIEVPGMASALDKAMYFLTLVKVKVCVWRSAIPWETKSGTSGGIYEGSPHRISGQHQAGFAGD